MNAAQRRKALRKSPQPGDTVQWRCMRIGWLTGTVRGSVYSRPYRRVVLELDGRAHSVLAARLTVIAKAKP